MSDTLNIKEFGEATDESGKHRLVLNCVEVAHPEADKGSTFYDFYSLVWESMDDNWTERRVISKADFEKGCERRRWVSKVHSMDAAGRAVIQVGEEGTPSVTGEMRVIYSWREWDLAHNQEVRLIRVCRSPFEPFDGNFP